MNPLNSILILVATFLAVFCETTFNGIRHLLGAQIDLLPALIVCASLRTGLATMSSVASPESPIRMVRRSAIPMTRWETG